MEHFEKFNGLECNVVIPIFIENGYSINIIKTDIKSKRVFIYAEKGIYYYEMCVNVNSNNKFEDIVWIIDYNKYCDEYSHYITDLETYYHSKMN